MDQLDSQKIAIRYAKAVLEAADESGKRDEVTKAFEQLQRLYLDVPELNTFFINPAIPADDKRAVVQDKFQKNVPPLVGNLMLILSDNDRLPLIPGILNAYLELVKQASGLATADVTVPVAINDALEAKLKKSLEDLLGYKEVALNVTVDPAILAGAIVRIGDKLIDGSYRGKLDMLRKQAVG